MKSIIILDWEIRFYTFHLSVKPAVIYYKYYTQIGDDAQKNI